MKKSLLFIFVLLGAFSSMAQNPFAEYGYTPKIATLSQGKYNETFDSDTLVQIGSVLFNTKSKQIVAFVQLDTLYSEATLEPDIVSRWLSPDPLADEYPSWSPYNFVLNNPIRYIDPDGRMPTDPLFNKGMGNGAINAVKGFWNFVADTYATRGGNIVDAAVGAKNFAVAAYNDPSGTADAVVAATKQGVVNSVVENGSINGALGAITGEVAVGVFTGMAADKGLSKLGTFAKVADKVEDVAQGVSPNVQKVLNTIDDIKSQGGTVKLNPLNPTQEINMTFQNGTQKLDFRIETHPLPNKFGGDGITPQRHMNVDLYPNKKVIPNSGHKILE